MTFGVGVGTSPLLHGKLVIVLCDEDNGERSFIVALDSASGKEVWRVKRDVELSWATPILVKSNGRDELVTAGNQAVIAYDPASGRELWRMKGLASNAVPSPVAGDGVVVVSSGYPAKIAVAVQPGGTLLAERGNEPSLGFARTRKAGEQDDTGNRLHGSIIGARGDRATMDAAV